LIDGYTLFSLTRASAIVKRQLTITLRLLADHGTFSPAKISVVDRTDSLLVAFGVTFGSNLYEYSGLRPDYCRCVHQ
jgi:hypothetical protein